MSFPCIDPFHFTTDADGGLTPQPYMQWRHVATNSAASIQNVYDYNAGSGQAGDLLQLQVAWTNVEPLQMKVYGLLTRGGSILTNTGRNRVYIETYWGSALGTAPADPTASTLFGRFGQGSDLGEVGGRVAFSNFQVRQGERTNVLGSTVTVPSGDTYKLRIRLRFDGSNWESTQSIPGTDAESELSIITGATRLDLYSYPDL